MKNNTFKYRSHMGSLSESMKTQEEFKTKEELADYLRSTLDCFISKDPNCSKITIEKYGTKIDTRNNWDTHIVKLEGYGVLGFTNKMPISQDRAIYEEGAEDMVREVMHGLYDAMSKSGDGNLSISQMISILQLSIADE